MPSHLDDELWGDALGQVAHPVDDNLWYVVVGRQLDLELDGGGVVLGLAQVMLTPGQRYDDASDASFKLKIICKATQRGN